MGDRTEPRFAAAEAAEDSNAPDEHFEAVLEDVEEEASTSSCRSWVW